MATVNLYRATNMANYQVWYGVLESYSSSQITIRAGALTGTYLGDFSFDQAGRVYGQLEGFEQRLNGNLMIEAKGLIADANRVFSYVDAEDARAAIGYCLRFSDQISGSAGNDVINAFGGKDRVAGNGGADGISGMGGDDRLKGGAGADRITGGSGADSLWGGADGSVDTFIFASRSETGLAPGERDVIFDFRVREDRISLAMIDADTGDTGNQAFLFGGRTGAANSVWWTDAGRNVIVRADVTGDGRADFSIVVLGVSALSADNFVL